MIQTFIFFLSWIFMTVFTHLPAYTLLIYSLPRSQSHPSFSKNTNWILSHLCLKPFISVCLCHWYKSQIPWVGFMPSLELTVQITSTFIPRSHLFYPIAIYIYIFPSLPNYLIWGFIPAGTSWNAFSIPKLFLSTRWVRWHYYVTS